MEDAQGLSSRNWTGKDLPESLAVDTASVLRSASFSDRHPGSYRSRIFSLRDNNTAIRTTQQPFGVYCEFWKAVSAGGSKETNQRTSVTMMILIDMDMDLSLTPANVVL
jgi:hypothetical protein